MCRYADADGEVRCVSRGVRAVVHSLVTRRVKASLARCGPVLNLYSNQCGCGLGEDWLTWDEAKMRGVYRSRRADKEAVVVHWGMGAAGGSKSTAAVGSARWQVRFDSAAASSPFTAWWIERESQHKQEQCRGCHLPHNNYSPWCWWRRLHDVYHAADLEQRLAEL
jgi:hypothetical protein